MMKTTMMIYMMNMAVGGITYQAQSCHRYTENMATINLKKTLYH